MIIRNSARLLLLALFTVMPLAAINPRPVPNVPLTPVSNTAGAEPQMSATLFPETGQVLLLIISPDSPESKVLLSLLNSPPDGVTLGPGIVIVVEDRDAAAHALDLRTLYPKLAAVSWFADEDCGLRTALELIETPVAIGVRNGKTHWSVAGLTADPMAQKNALLGWIGAGQTIASPLQPSRAN